MPRKEYKLLSVIRVVFRIFAVMALISGIISFLAILIGGGQKAQVPKIVSVIWLLGGLFYSMVLLLISELSLVLIKIEQNTRTNQRKEEAEGILPKTTEKTSLENQDTKLKEEKRENEINKKEELEKDVK